MRVQGCLWAVWNKEQKGPLAAPEGRVGGDLESRGTPEPGAEGSRGDQCGPGSRVAGGYCVGSLGLEFPTVLAPIG